MNYLILSGKSGNSEIAIMEYQNKKIVQLFYQNKKCLVMISYFSMTEPVNDVFEFSVKF